MQSFVTSADAMFIFTQKYDRRIAVFDGYSYGPSVKYAAH